MTTNDILHFLHIMPHSTYIVIVPSEIRPGVPLNISVNILKARANVNVKADLIENTNNHVATAHGVFSQSKFIILPYVKQNTFLNTYDYIHVIKTCKHNLCVKKNYPCI